MLINLEKLRDADFNVISNGLEIEIKYDFECVLIKAMTTALQDVSPAIRDSIINEALRSYEKQVVMSLCD